MSNLRTSHIPKEIADQLYPREDYEVSNPTITMTVNDSEPVTTTLDELRTDPDVNRLVGEVVRNAAGEPEGSKRYRLPMARRASNAQRAVNDILAEHEREQAAMLKLTSYRTKDIAERCGLRESDVSSLLRIARQTGRYTAGELHGGAGQPYRITQKVYDALFSGLEAAYRDVQQSELDAKQRELEIVIKRQEAAIRERVIRADARRTDDERLAEARARRAFKFHRRGGAHMRLAAAYQRRGRVRP